MILAPICHKCRVEMRCKKNGFAVQIGFTVFSADLYKCPKCGHEVITEVARQGIPADEWCGDVCYVEG